MGEKGRESWRSRGRRSTSHRLAAVALCCLALACSPTDSTVESGPSWEWGHYASDAASSKYAPLDEIDEENFDRLEIAWSWVSADVAWQAALQKKRDRGVKLPFNIRPNLNVADFEGTPLMIGGVLYGSTSIGQVYALDAGSGETLWVHDPRSYRSSRKAWDFTFLKHRGVSYWEDGDDRRIFIPTIDAFLVALDARTGKPIEDFGKRGRVDLLQGLRGTPIPRLAQYFQSSPAAISGDTVIVGSSQKDRPVTMRGTPGDIRGYDARTGRQKWSFHVIPEEGEPGVETWGDDSWKYSGAANAWGPMSVDAERGLVYIPTSTPTNDLYGGHRPGDNLYAETLLCLDAETGERVWHQQIVHHGIWDYDLSAPPNLLTVNVAGRSVDVVALVTKMGFTFVHDRVTGEPIWPIEERPVPASDVPGEIASPTQPFPTRPPPFERQGTSESDLIDLTPELHAAALEIFRSYRSGPLYTPPSLGRGTLALPSPDGGANWRGAGVDPETGVLFVPSITRAAVLSVKEGTGTDMRYVTDQVSPQWLPPSSAPGSGLLPLVKPPFSRITAIDLNAGELLWQVPSGDGPRDDPRLAHLDLPPLGSGVPTCALVTKTLLIAADGGDLWHAIGKPILWAYDKATGERVGSVPLPAKARGCPMTYQHRGRQYIAVPVGDNGGDPLLVALKLPGR